MNDLVILSPCFYETAAPAILMVQSAGEHELDVRLFGIGQPFIPHGADAQVFRLREFMRQEKLAHHVLVTDCRDVLFLASAVEILNKFYDRSEPIVMSTETGCWPPDEEVVKHFFGRNPYGYNFVNAGQYVGVWNYVEMALDHLLTNYRDKAIGLDNSQGWWHQAIMRDELEVALDSKCSIFQTMSGGVDGHVVVSGDRVLNTVTGETPCSVHFNGNPGVTDPHAKMWKELRNR